MGTSELDEGEGAALREAFRSGPTAEVAGELRRLGELALLLCGNRTDAEDAAAEAVARVLGGRQLAGIEQVGPYLRRTLVNLLARRGRRLGYERRALARLGAPEDSRPVEDEVSERSDLRRALDSLSLEQRAVVVLRYFDDMSERQISEVLGVPVGTVKSRAARALSAMRPLLARGDGDE